MDKFDVSYKQAIKSASTIIDTLLRPFDNIDTIATHAGYDPFTVPGIGHPVVPPITLATTFQQFEMGSAKYDYSRAGNFSRECLEKCIAELENGTACSVFSSGLAAVSAAVQLLQHGDHIVAFDDLYGGSSRYLRTVAVKSGITWTVVDMRDPAKFNLALQENTRLVICETPSNPLMRLIDLKKIVQVTKAYNKDILVVADNTFMSSYFQRPLDFGVDIVLHSLTKYMNGHSDVVMGALVTKNNPELVKKFTFTQLATGAVPSPFDCYLCLRGLRTLPVRMRAHMWNGLLVSLMLERHPRVKQVLHPALQSHPQHELAVSQMRGFSGMVSIYLNCSSEETRKFARSLSLFMLAESLGGYESLIEIPSIMTHASVPEEIRAANGMTDNLIRLSIGLEDPKDLVLDLYQGLATLDEPLRKMNGIHLLPNSEHNNHV